MSKDILAPRNGKEPFQHLFHLCIHPTSAFPRPPFQAAFNDERTVKVILKWLLKTLYAIFHKVEHFAAADARAPSQNGGGA